MDNTEKFVAQDFLMQLEQINYLDIVKIFGPLLVYYINKRVIDTYTLHRDHKPQNIKKVNLPPELKIEYDSVDINNIVSSKLRLSLIQFINLMVETFPKKDLINFYNNINTLKTSYSTFKVQKFILGRNAIGAYNAMRNEIVVVENDFSETIFHELLHMASTTYGEGIRYTGFCQVSLKHGVERLGRGINEGYTELLNRRYFVEQSHPSSAYEYQTFVAGKVEAIVGQTKMESLYLSANLYGLIQELKQYASEEELMEFISDTDFLLKHIDDRKLMPFEKGMINKSLKNINMFLIKSYLKKLLIQYKQNNITIDELTHKLSTYVSQLPKTVKIHKNIYELLSDDELTECFKSVTGQAHTILFTK